MSSNSKLYENVIYKGEPGTLTLKDKVFHYEATNKDANVKCSWARVERRQLSPPGAAQPMLKLILVSGRTAVFEVAETQILLDLVKDVKIRMEQSQTNKEQAREQALGKSQQENEDKLDNSKRQSVREWKDDVEAPKTRRSSNTQPPVLQNQDEYLSRAHDKRDDSRRTVCYCCWDSIYCWLCMAATVAVIILVALLVYFFVIRDSDSSSEKTRLSLCEDPSSPQCPPDDGLEDRYGIRGVEYIWTPELVRLEYYISDYILDSSVNYTLYDGVECRDSQDEVVPAENEWLRVDLVDGAPADGGANVYNEGKGTRQFDIVLTPKSSDGETQLSDAPFYTENLAAANGKAFLRICVGFSVQYNQVDGYQESKEVNYIENAVQMSIDASDESKIIIQDVQQKTVTTPKYKL